jgi:hypothetical protein
MTAETAHTPCAPARKDHDQTCHDAVVIDLVACARAGAAQAWGAAS